MNGEDRSAKRPSLPPVVKLTLPALTPLQAALCEFARSFEFARETLDESAHDTIVDVLTVHVARLNADRIVRGADERR